MLLILTYCTHKVTKPKINTFNLSYIGDFSQPANLQYLKRGQGYRIAYLPSATNLIAKRLNLDLSNIDLIISADQTTELRAISPYGGYLIKRFGKARVCIWARLDPPVMKDSIRFLYLKQKPMLEMRSDFIIAIGGSEAMIDVDSPPTTYRFDFTGRKVFESSQETIKISQGEKSLVVRFDSILSTPIFKVDNVSSFLESLRLRIAVDSLVVPDDLDLPDLAGEISMKDLGSLLNICVRVDTNNSRAYLGLLGHSLVEFLMR